MIRNAAATIVIAAVLGIGAALAADHPYSAEPAARTCIDKRISELLDEGSRNVTADAALQACTNDLRAEIKGKSKSDCEAADYVGWLVANVNSKRYGLAGQSYKPDRDYLARCKKAGGASPAPPSPSADRPKPAEPAPPRSPQ
jgi:hypothetical protein